jgi:7,8-dihydropterin-6-yl-methyl-4-(beta-D-ribofuranosyl)aminobenzene 5'-phosphate synthase
MKRLYHSKIALMLLVTGLLFVAPIATCNQAAETNATGSSIEITVLYDNYTLTEGCTTDWGFACIITGTEKCILFDTGTNGSILLGNMDKLQVSAGDVELVVISHFHTDHTGGLSSFLAKNSNVTAYLPLTASSGLVQTVRSRGATALLPTDTVQICEGAHVAGLTIMGHVEQFLVLETPKGLVVITGCAHPGIVQIVQKAKEMLEKDVYFVFGGFHLLNDSNSQVMRTIGQFQELGVRKVGASHCTGDRAIELFEQEYGKDFVPIGVGRLTIPLEYDLTGDGIVDCADMCIIVDHWQTNEPSCDIAPGLFGDGIVDLQDLVALAEHLFEEVKDPTLIAHWPLDEAQGVRAYDSVADCDGTLMGGPLWQPDGGMVDGALQFDGVDDWILTGSIPNSIKGPFSVFAWVKGGAPGQVVISQRSGVNWLCADTSEGNLMTELMGTGRIVAILPSQAVITDGEWHRIGLVWDGSRRQLYVDGLAVAEDTRGSLEVSQNGLYIGTGKAMEPGTFWTGLIDDVRIYNRVVKP